ncbi:MAG: helix-turn-helix transcriptional regulator [Verrucomicrobiota bacterium]
MLTTSAAKELGRGLRFLRHAQNLTLRDVSKRSGLSPQYVQNIERGERVGTTDEAFEKLAAGYGVPFDIVSDLLLKARVVSALDARGLDPEAQGFIWRGVEQRLSERGVAIRTDIATIVASLIG